MNSSVQRRSGGARGQTQSLFFRDIASPISSHAHQYRSGGGSGSSSGKFVTPSKAAAVSAIWKENFTSSSSTSPSDLPPPPIFTLEDRAADFSPEALDLPPPPSPEYRHRNPVLTPASAEKKDVNLTHASGIWWSPARNGSGGEGERVGSPVDGVVQSGALVMFPPPREVVRPVVRRENLMPAGGLDVEEWVTVYGFSPGDTNLVLREFEKCGVVLKHIAGPRDANWMHILYQNRYDSQKALAKNGMQINNVLIVGVKPVDHMQRQFLNEKLNTNNQGGFTVRFPPLSSVNGRSTEGGVPTSSKQSATTVGISDIGRRSDGGAIAVPAKSMISKAMDLMFGL